MSQAKELSVFKLTVEMRRRRAREISHFISVTGFFPIKARKSVNLREEIS